MGESQPARHPAEEAGRKRRLEELEQEVAAAQAREAELRKQQLDEEDEIDQKRQEELEELHDQLEEARNDLADAEMDKVHLMENLATLQAWIKRKQEEEAAAAGALVLLPVGDDLFFAFAQHPRRDFSRVYVRLVGRERWRQRTRRYRPGLGA